jgi:hypothetical protein
VQLEGLEIKELKEKNRTKTKKDDNRFISLACTELQVTDCLCLLSVSVVYLPSFAC